jgi:hypothetical protein
MLIRDQCWATAGVDQQNKATNDLLTYMQPSTKKTVETIGLRTCNRIKRCARSSNAFKDALHSGLHHRYQSAFDDRCNAACNVPTTPQTWLHKLAESADM